MNLTLLTPELAVLGLALLVFLADLFTKDGGSKRFLGWFSAAGYTAILGYVLSQGLDHQSPKAFGGLFVADGLSQYFKALFLAAAALTSLASIDALDERQVRWQGEYYFLLSMVTSAMMFMVSAGDLLTLYVALEFNSLGFYALVAIFKGRSLVSSEAGIKYLMLGAIASALLLYGASILYGLSGTLSLPGLASWAHTAQPSAVLVIALVMVVAGLAFKVSLAPFHMWSPDVYQAAPTPITAYLSVGSKAAGIALIIRVLSSTLGDLSKLWVFMLMALMALTFVWANVVALKQKDLKRLLAYSSIAQAAYFMIGIAAGSVDGLQAVLFYSLVYLFTNMAAFQVAQLVSAHSGREDLGGLTGLSTRSPALALIMMSAILSLAGIPPFGGFFGKYFLFATGVQEGIVHGNVLLLGLVALAVVMSIVSLFYYLIVVKQMYIEPATEHGAVPTPVAARLGLTVCIVMIVITGVYPSPFLDWIKQALP